MEKRLKYILIGIAIGIVIGMFVFYILLTSGVIRPYLAFRGFDRPGNFTNFSRGPGFE